MNYGKGIGRARLGAGMSKRQLALQAGLDPSYITHIESSRKRPSLSALESIAEVLRVPIPVLMLWCAEDEDLSGIDASQGAELASQIFNLLRALP